MPFGKGLKRGIITTQVCNAVDLSAVGSRM